MTFQKRNRFFHQTLVSEPVFIGAPSSGNFITSLRDTHFYEMILRHRRLTRGRRILSRKNSPRANYTAARNPRRRLKAITLSRRENKWTFSGCHVSESTIEIGEIVIAKSFQRDHLVDNEDIVFSEGARWVITRRSARGKLEIRLPKAGRLIPGSSHARERGPRVPTRRQGPRES